MVATVSQTAPVAVAIIPDGKHAYVNNGGETVSVIDTATNAVVATVVVPAGAGLGVAVAPNGGRVYVTGELSNTVSVIDTSSNTIVATISSFPVGIEPRGVAVTPDGKYAYVANCGSSNVSVIDTATNTVVATVAG